ncbi:MAG: TVP38/TMEM64 family protein [Hyphomonas sp.]|uniref:TVP38/TMEM64 family protein n=1 Tax=Hyphomonas sp. TaxID=87 RepID=UPI00181C9D8D|nr:VTT domain-containing protein [Hyphomonas sp.]MBA3068380.1 TVP38/TMEM64 family protein [Hyphomonas sp.]MBU3921528.1 VTT domain-containing protein [Alphaproteobacteria bacterium]MBU4060753.1 VTT domain-containing protein [Alphaproteobacteria bacterium]MBU4164737.1 VTT domain-containing protein [Alphaproteobacteria bacterium]
MTHETAAPAPVPRRALYLGLGLLALVLGVFALGKLGYLPGLEQAETWLQDLAGSPWGLPAVIAVFCIAAFIGVPQFALIAAAVAVFGPLMGAAYGWIANMVSGALTFWIGRTGGEAAVRRYAGPRARKLSRLIGQNALIASAVVRSIPAGPFLIVNMVFGASAAKFRDFWIGMGLGILPKIALVAVGWKSVESAFAGNPLVAGLFGAGALALYAGIAYFVVRRARRAWQDIPDAPAPAIDTGQERGE